MSIKIYRAVYQKGNGGTYFDRSNLNFHRWVLVADMAAAKSELLAVVEDGVPPIIIGWEEMALEADEE